MTEPTLLSSGRMKKPPTRSTSTPVSVALVPSPLQPRNYRNIVSFKIIHTAYMLCCAKFLWAMPSYYLTAEARAMSGHGQT